jgi:hypothetical protein
MVRLPFERLVWWSEVEPPLRKHRPIDIPLGALEKLPDAVSKRPLALRVGSVANAM